MPDFLTYRPELPDTCWEMLETKRVLPVADLLRHLKLAEGYLKNTPGQHREERNDHVDEWLGWWIRFLEEFGDSLDSEIAGRKLLTPDEVAQANDEKKNEFVVTANLFANGREGHPGHRYAISYCTSILRRGFVGLLLDEHMTPGKSRERHYLPLQLRLSMWAYYFSYVEGNPPRATGLDYVSVIPKKPEGIKVDEYYDQIFRDTHAMFHFVGRQDPHFEQKFRRNSFDNGWPKEESPWMIFDYLNDASLMEEVFSFDLVNTLRTSWRAQRLLDRSEEESEWHEGILSRLGKEEVLDLLMEMQRAKAEDYKRIPDLYCKR